jgi:cation transport ATPase
LRFFACAGGGVGPVNWYVRQGSQGRSAVQGEQMTGESSLHLNSSRREDEMTNSKHIAGLIGPTLIALTISEAMNLHIWATNIAPVTYLNGLLLFVAGLSIVRAHNRWTRSWPVMVTLVGWCVILLGLFRMFAPEAQQGGENIPTYAVIIVLFAIGIFLTFKAYSREDSNAAAR